MNLKLRVKLFPCLEYLARLIIGLSVLVYQYWFGTSYVSINSNIDCAIFSNTLGDVIILQIDMDTFLVLTEKDLTEVGVSNQQDRAKLMALIGRLCDNPSPVSIFQYIPVY